jgi:hypothetical protein
MRRVAGIVSLIGIAVAIALATLTGQIATSQHESLFDDTVHDLAVLRGRCDVWIFRTSTSRTRIRATRRFNEGWASVPRRDDSRIAQRDHRIDTRRR